MTNPLVWPNGLASDVSTLTASQLEQLDQQQAGAIDGVGGGGYTPTSDIDITDGAGGGLGDVDVRGLLHFKGAGNPREALKHGSLPTADHQDLGIASGGQILRFADHTGQPVKNHDMDNANAVAGDWLRLVRDNAGANDIVIHKDGSGYAGAAIVTLTTGGHRTCLLYFDGTDWRLGMYSPGCTPGADA